MMSRQKRTAHPLQQAVHPPNQMAVHQLTEKNEELISPIQGVVVEHVQTVSNLLQQIHVSI